MKAYLITMLSIALNINITSAFLLRPLVAVSCCCLDMGSVQGHIKTDCTQYDSPENLNKEKQKGLDRFADPTRVWTNPVKPLEIEEE